MKLDWEINNCRVLGAKVGEVTYYVAPGVVNLWTPSKRYAAFDGKVATVWPVEGGMSLTNAIAWCERDVERPEGCPAQPPAMDPVATKTSDGVPKFPNTLDASVWASRATAWFGAFKVPDLTEWFDAALARGYREGRDDKKDLLDCFTPHQLHNMASGGKSNQAAELLEVEAAARTLAFNRLRAWYQMNAAPPSTEAAPPRPEDPLQSFDARIWAKEFMRCNNGLSGPFVSSHVRVDEETMVGWFANALMRGYDERRSGENGWQKFTRDTYAEFLAKNPYPPPPSAQASEPPSVEERLLRCEAECREQRSRMDACEHRTIGLYVPEWKERLYSITQRISELETWLGSKKYAPEDNFASKTWVKLEQLTNRLEKLEART